jgi:transcriptional regulator with XRE-family HTH domain
MLVGVSQSEIARRGNFSITYANRVVNGTQKPSKRFIASFCEVTGLTKEDLFEDEKVK